MTKERTKIWVPKGIKTKDIHRIIERNGYENDTLGQELYAPNVVPYVITVAVEKIKGRKRSKKGQLEIELSDTKSLVFAGNQVRVKDSLADLDTMVSYYAFDSRESISEINAIAVSPTEVHIDYCGYGHKAKKLTISGTAITIYDCQ